MHLISLLFPVNNHPLFRLVREDIDIKASVKPCCYFLLYFHCPSVEIEVGREVLKNYNASHVWTLWPDDLF